MNQTQRKYALERITSLEAKKLQEVMEKHRTPAVTLTSKQRYIAFRKGEYKINPDAEHKISGYTDVTDLIIFDAERPERIDTDSVEKQKAILREKSSRIRDQIMLGDAEEAMRLINQFIEFKV